MAALHFRDWILKAVEEVEFSSCQGCIYREQNEAITESPLRVCALSAHMTEKYSLDCNEDTYIFVEHQLLTNLTKL